ncbi:hypothetical protein [Falsibacillus albus]|uniref:hypothetical protein n=1 Tax=Falsibacillus albus TaxID=2478915 RepID=UPI0011E5E801|nr:hypothetical protein [Falsibacillus albus]
MKQGDRVPHGVHSEPPCLLPESRAMGQKWSSKRPFAARLESDGVRMVTKAAVCCPARERWGKNGHQRGRLMIESRAIG